MKLVRAFAQSNKPPLPPFAASNRHHHCSHFSRGNVIVATGIFNYLLSLEEPHLHLPLLEFSLQICHRREVLATHLPFCPTWHPKSPIHAGFRTRNDLHAPTLLRLVIAYPFSCGTHMSCLSSTSRRFFLPHCPAAGRSTPLSGSRDRPAPQVQPPSSGHHRRPPGVGARWWPGHCYLSRSAP
jgi:hypothetical protein